VVFSLICFGAGLFFVYPWGVGVEPVDETVSIPLGEERNWDVETRGFRLYYHVEVVYGGYVNVLVTEFTSQGGQYGNHYIPDHQHYNVGEVEGTVLPNDDRLSLDLIVKNTADQGPQGNVTVNVIIEHRPTYPIWQIAMISVAMGALLLLIGLRNIPFEEKVHDAIDRDIWARQRGPR